MQYVTTAERIGIEKGEQIGIVKGEQIGIVKGELIGEILMAQKFLKQFKYSPEGLKKMPLAELQRVKDDIERKIEQV